MENRDLSDIEQNARRDGVPLMLDDGMEFLKEYIRTHPYIMRILECGTAVGWSAMQMASVRDNITIDTFEIDRERYNQAVRNVKQAGLDDRIHCHCMDALDFNTVSYYDLFFIDAAKSQYRRYLEHFYQNSYPGSVFFFDNLNFHGIVDHPERSHNRSTVQMTHKIHKFRDWLLQEERFDTVYYPEIGDGVAAAVRKKEKKATQSV